MSHKTVELPEAEVTVQIPFHDVDLMEIAWHGHYVKYFEIARDELLEGIGYNHREMRDSGFAWPVIELKMRYAKPASLGQRIKVRARIVEYELRLKISYLVTDLATGARLTRGHTIQVAVEMSTQELVLGSPPILFEKLGVTE